MKFTEKVVKELLQIRGIKNPRALFGKKKFESLMNFAHGKSAGIRLSTIHLLAKMLNVPAGFIIRILFLGRKIGDETINWRYKSFDRDVLW